MAGNNMNLNASLRLHTKEFKRGIKDVQNSLKGLQRSFLSVAGALGAGLGFSKLLSDMKNTAVQLSVAEATLRNVSQVTKTFTDGTNKMDVAISNYGENLKYVQDLAKKYGQDQIALTQNFAQFTAACRGTNITLEQQRDIFDALTQAATYYHMSASQVDDMQRAIVQMASKGRVMSEELRRQLGNSLPGAFNLMAASLGVSNAELEEMMRNGEVLAEDALPKFAAMLKTVTSGYNLDSLQIKLNQLKNSWTEMVKSSDFERGMKWLVDQATNVVNWFSEYFWPKILGIGIGAGAGLGAPRVFSWWTESLKAETAKMQQEYAAAESNITKMQKGLNKVNYFYRENGSNLYRVNTESLSKEASDHIFRGGWEEYRKELQLNMANLREYNRELAKTENLRKSVYEGGTPLVTEKELEDIEKIENISRKLNLNDATETLKDVPPTINQATAASRTLAGVWKTIRTLFKTAFASIGIGLLIGGITTLIGKWIELGQKMKEARNIYKQYEEDVKGSNAAVIANAAVLESNLRILQDTDRESTNSMAKRIAALKKINELTGEKYSTKLIAEKDAINEANRALGKTANAYDDIITKVKNWIEQTKIQAKIQVQAQKQGTAVAEIDRLEAENQEISEKIWNPKNIWEQFQRVSLRKRYKANQVAIEQYRKVVKATEEALDELGVNLAEYYDTGGGNDFEDPGKVKGAQKALEDYTEAVEKLERKFKEGLVSEKDYYNELFKLTKKAQEEAAESGEVSWEGIIDKLDKGKPLTKLEQWYEDLFVKAAVYGEEVLKFQNEELAKELQDDIDKELDKISQEELEKFQENLEKLNELKMPEFKGPETWDNYKQKDYEIWKENAEALEDYAKDIKDLMDDLKKLGPEGAIAFDNLKGKLEELSNTAKTLRDKARVEEWKEDIKELQEQFGTDFYNSIKNVAQGFERLYDTFKDLQDRFDDAEGIEQVILAFETVFEVLETGMAIYETFKKLTETTTALQKAQGDLQMQNMQKELAMKGAITAADVAGATTAAEAGAVKIATAHATANALKSVATAGAAANAMQVPYPGNLVALATNMAALAGALAAGKGFQAFKDGGIVNGPATGDRTLIRANGGEMMLNKSQQNDLWNFIKNGSQGFGGGQVDFKIRGADLVGTIKNYESRLRG